jgi:hypothetical protein
MVSRKKFSALPETRRTAMVSGRARLQRLRKNSSSSEVREEHEFIRAVKSLKMSPRFSL